MKKCLNFIDSSYITSLIYPYQLKFMMRIVYFYKLLNLWNINKIFILYTCMHVLLRVLEK